MLALAPAILLCWPIIRTGALTHQLGSDIKDWSTSLPFTWLDDTAFTLIGSDLLAIIGKGADIID